MLAKRIGAECLFANIQGAFVSALGLGKPVLARIKFAESGERRGNGRMVVAVPPLGERERALGQGDRSGMATGFAKLLDAPLEQSLPLCTV